MPWVIYLYGFDALGVMFAIGDLDPEHPGNPSHISQPGHPGQQGHSNGPGHLDLCPSISVKPCWGGGGGIDHSNTRLHEIKILGFWRVR